MKYNKEDDPLKNNRQDFINFIEKHVKELDFHRYNKLLSIHHYPMIVIFENL